MAKGRGAWTPTGKGNKERQYKFVAKKPVDGATPDKSVAYRAVNLGVKAIQTQLNAEGYTPALTVDGKFGEQTAAAVSWFQGQRGLTVDGVAGAKTCLALWHKPIAEVAAAFGIQANYLYGQVVKESSGDPAACGYHHAPDRGLVQINTAIHSEVSLNKAHETQYALRWSAGRLKEALAKSADSDQDLALRAALLRHNSPAGADKLLKTGQYPSAAAQAYVESVLREADGWSD